MLTSLISCFFFLASLVDYVTSMPSHLQNLVLRVVSVGSMYSVSTLFCSRLHNPVCCFTWPGYCLFPGSPLGRRIGSWPIMVGLPVGYGSPSTKLFSLSRVLAPVMWKNNWSFYLTLHTTPPPLPVFLCPRLNTSQSKSNLVVPNLRSTNHMWSSDHYQVVRSCVIDLALSVIY